MYIPRSAPATKAIQASPRVGGEVFQLKKPASYRQHCFAVVQVEGEKPADLPLHHATCRLSNPRARDERCHGDRIGRTAEVRGACLRLDCRKGSQSAAKTKP